MKRRVFVGSAFAGLGLTGAYARPPKPKAGGVPTKVYGKTGAKVTIIAQGGARMDLFPNVAEAAAHIRRVYEMGLNYFDCAHAYWDGKSEEAYGIGLQGVRKNVFLTGKTTKRTRQETERELALSLKALKTDPANHAALLNAHDKWDSVLMPVHAADHAYLSFEKTALPVAVAKGIGVQAIKVFCKAFLLRALSPRECLTYTLSMPVHVAICGAGTEGQMEDNVRTAQSFKPLTAEELADMRRRAVVGQGVYTGPTMEYWKKVT